MSKSTLTKWKRPSNYVGPDHTGYYVGPGQNRDSDALSRSNFRVALERLGGESICECEGDDCACPVQVIRDSHWAVGWIEYILVHESAADKVAILEEIENSLADYPVLDEDDFSQEEEDEAELTLTNCAGEFRREILSFIFDGRLDSARDKYNAALDELAAAVFQEDMGYCGMESAYVTEDSIKRLAESNYPPYPELAKNLFYRLARVRLGLSPVPTKRSA